MCCIDQLRPPSVGVMRNVAATICVVTALTAALAEAAEFRSAQRIYWPKLMLFSSRGERIEAIDIVMTCGRFRGISKIPDDWSIEVVSPSSEVTRLHASAGHGATMLWSLAALDGSISIAARDSSCLKISATIKVDVGGESSKIYQLNESDLRLRP